ncbi:hypothetical protein DE4585_00002 [Mycobacteroides salmoniphilum]|uniref:Integral membrane protein n=1 Tax=Mycobacteroides salmoniphilum TaxID=404941 RepID=A0A4R8S7W8_9MYCO|nr:hypothetical protein [Mycobacteroides salmoniphilum]TDZ82153.1 hypothetical protein DE4586_00041 [Mycobacteroides salmoniphilum]TDZ82234.1 hypothetical protein DE4587_04643 [Mycobacteroides salmoniphilum]TDZ87015.1 hypothetical protein DE4585_00002 [Mycobacteroides salmoniphilum]
MGTRFLLQQWWVRFAIMAGGGAALYIPFWLLYFGGRATDPRWLALQAGVVAIGIAVLAVGIQQRPHRYCTTAVAGLDKHQRSQAITSLRRGDPPDDPAVRAAAIQMGSVILETRKQAPRWLIRLWWLPIVLMISGASLMFYSDGTRRGLAHLLLVLMVSVPVCWSEYYFRRVQHQMRWLEAAAGSPPDAAPAVPPRYQPPPRSRLLIAAVIIGAVGGGLAVVNGGKKPTDCETALNVVGIYLDDEHRDLTKSNLIGPGGPPISAYQDWADRMRAHPTLSDQNLAERVQRLTDLADQSVDIVKRSRETAVDTAAYEATVQQILHESEAIINVCKAQR